MLHGWRNIGEAEERLILDGIRDNAVYGGPYHVEFSPTDACNYECFFCNSAFVDRSKRLPWDRMERLLEELRGMGTRSIRLSGGGEPLIYPQIDKVVDFCIEHGIAISNITTNGYKLTPALTDRLLRADFEELIVSFNDITAAQYAKTNGTTERAYQLVLDNIKHLIDERGRRGLTQPTVIQQFFVFKGNHRQIERAYDLGLQTGADKIYLRDMGQLKPEERMTPDELRTAGEAVERIRQRDKEAGKLILGFSYEKILETILTPDEKQADHRRNLDWHPLSWRRPPGRTEYCYIGWYSTVIRGNGDIFPCCMLSVDPDYKPMANLHDFGSFREAWEGEAYRALRTELRQMALSRGDYGAVTTPCHTRHYCAMRDACPFVANLARPEFYAAVEGAIDPLREARPSLLGRMKAALLG
jgi:MoaA/NifB/PqqE/SkfB family radical SAM enzyme